MQGLITLDFGNTHPHAGIFLMREGRWELLRCIPWSELSSQLEHLGLTPNNSQLVLCEVREREEELLPLLRQGFLLTRIKDYWKGGRFAGMPVNYANSLGEDRLIVAHYCYKQDRKKTLLIDAGTYPTLDLVGEEGFLGGYIVPGLSAYFSSFSSGERLKDVQLVKELSGALPQTTALAMQEGYGAFGAWARELVTKHEVKRIILTGGSSDLWRGFFKDSPAELIIEPHYIHWAIQHWMTTQIEPL